MKTKSSFFIFSFLLAWSVNGFAQNTLGQNQYKSPVDQFLTIDRITVSPFFDNADGIYARPLERHLIESLKEKHRFNFIPSSSDFPPTAPEAFLRDSELVKTFSAKENVDAFLSARVTNFPSSLEISMYLFLAKDGDPLVQGELKNLKNDSIEFLQSQMDLLVEQVFGRIPYSGQVMSREGLRVTVNLGTKDGLRKGDELTAVQFLKLNRHPKLKFLINSEKEVIGKIKLLKVEPTLSFGAITMEKEKGVLEKGSKINELGEVRYSDIDVGLEDVSQKNEVKENYAFGKNPREWRPLEAPVFGQVYGRVGLMRFQQNTSLSGVGALSSKDDFAPMVDLGGELWITSEWTAHAQIRQGLVSVSNPRSGSTPSTLSQSLSAYELLFGYRFRFAAQGPASFAEPFVGYFKHELYSDTAQPEVYTSMKYSGLKVGLLGEFPITADDLWRGGGKVSFTLLSNLSESPVTSGAGSENNVVQFQFYGSRALSTRLRILGAVDFEQLSTNFSGTGSRTESADSASLRYMIFSGGASYSF